MCLKIKSKLKSNWKEYSFKDFCDITSSKRIFYREYVKSGIPFYRSKEIIAKSNGKELNDCLYISKDRFEEIKNKYGIPINGDILITAVGTYGIPYLINEDGDFYFKDGNLIWLKNIKDVADSNFLFYWFKSEEAKNKVEGIIIGSVQKALTIDAMKNIKINLPPLAEQKRIASILSALDDKIELNNKTNKILEEMAQTIFKEWFINFNFPNEDGKPYKKSGGEMIDSELGKIPKGWKVITLKDIISIAKGKKPKATSDKITEKFTMPYLTINCYNNEATEYTEYNEKMHVKELDIVMVMDGNAGKIFYGKEGILSSTMAKLIVEDSNLNELVFYFLKSIEYDLMYHTVGSVIQHADKQYMLNKKFCVSLDNLERLSDIFKCIRKEISLNKKENEKLSNIRDSLLPKLMTPKGRRADGEIRVNGSGNNGV